MLDTPMEAKTKGLDATIPYLDPSFIIALSVLLLDLVRYKTLCSSRNLDSTEIGEQK